jgi:hypothetical protein
VQLVWLCALLDCVWTVITIGRDNWRNTDFYIYKRTLAYSAQQKALI